MSAGPKVSSSPVENTKKQPGFASGAVSSSTLNKPARCTKLSYAMLTREKCVFKQQVKQGQCLMTKICDVITLFHLVPPLWVMVTCHRGGSINE